MPDLSKKTLRKSGLAACPLGGEKFPQHHIYDTTGSAAGYSNIPVRLSPTPQALPSVSTRTCDTHLKQTIHSKLEGKG